MAGLHVRRHGVTEDEAVAEDEAGLDDESHTVIDIPKELIPEVRRLIARYRAR